MKVKTKVEKVKSKGVLADYVKKADMSLYHHLKNRSLIAMKISKALKEAGLSKKEFAQKMGGHNIDLFKKYAAN